MVPLGNSPGCLRRITSAPRTWSSLTNGLVGGVAHLGCSVCRDQLGVVDRLVHSAVGSDQGGRSRLNELTSIAFYIRKHISHDPFTLLYSPRTHIDHVHTASLKTHFCGVQHICGVQSSRMPSSVCR
jgi:hypothetical protein